jgi:hypothetical protein
MASNSKAQTVVERAARRVVLGAQLTSHTCASPACSSPGEPIALGDLYPGSSPWRRTGTRSSFIVPARRT